MIDNAELGYTPANLVAIMAKHRLTQAEVAKITNTKQQSNVSRWRAELSANNHADMPYTKWMMLINFLKNN